jgi:hypothetical protein
MVKSNMKNMSTALEGEIFNYARKNIIKLNIYIKDPYVSKFMTEEKITEIAFVGMVGGILGLFLGSSFISFVEIPYILVIRLLVRVFRKGPKEKT